MEKKCSQCGSKKLVKRDYSFTDNMGMVLPVDIYVCEECGHIELVENKDKGSYLKK